VVLERTIDGRLFDGADGVVGERRARTFGRDGEPAERGLEGTVRALESARFAGQELRLHVGRWGARWGAPGGRQSGHFGSDWRDSGRKKGAFGNERRLP